MPQNGLAVCPVKLIDGRHIPVRPSNIVIASWLRWGVAARQIARKGEDDFIAASSGLGERTFRFIVIGKAVDRGVIKRQLQSSQRHWLSQPQVIRSL